MTKDAPSHAERARTLTASHRAGSLATIARDPAGYPFGSLVAYALDPGGHPLLLLSGLAEHTKNFAADPRASLLVCEDPAGTDPLALGRVTLLGRIERLPDEAREAAGEPYFAAHPRARSYLAMKDFAFYRLAVESVRYVGGFGRMSWVDAAAYLAAEPDPLSPSAADIIAHMNQDHGAAMLVYAKAWAGLADATEAKMLGVDRYGVDLSVVTEEGPRVARVGFAAPATTPEEARRELVRLAAEGRKKLAAG